jgi:hypothetical protein
VLFDGKETNRFVNMAGGRLNWPAEEGVLVSTANRRRSNHAVSTWHFRDAEIHVEFRLPEESDGNSGVYVQAVYELQILNSFGRQNPGEGDMGAVYGMFRPLANAARRPGAWQVYDIQYHAPRRDKHGTIAAQGTITAWLNGHRIQNRVSVGEPSSKYNPYRYDTTPYLQTIWKLQQQTGMGPLVLQDHDANVCFRNIWVRPLDDKAHEYAP